MALSRRVRERRQALGIRADDLAAQLGVSSEVLARIEDGTTRPSTGLLLGLANLLETTATDLLGVTGLPAPGSPPDPLLGTS